ncbi:MULTISPECIES: hypothetical protein [Sphingobacterium]|uniref:hypothetical protein n=1 Tax=Sphingobacterium TaxID=28453 RepID=UPI0013DAB81D|nr:MULTISPECIES: hypothetical protein [unclassified Sphingobacterium]
MTAVVPYHPSGIAKAGRYRALRIDSAAIGHPSWGQTYPMLYLGGGNRNYCYRPLFKRIRRRFAVFPARRYTGKTKVVRPNKESRRQVPHVCYEQTKPRGQCDCSIL